MLHIDAFALGSTLVYLASAGITLACTPAGRRAGAGRQSATVIAGTLLAYLGGSIWICLAGWVLTVLPLWRGPLRHSRHGLAGLVAAPAMAAVAGLLAATHLAGTPDVALVLLSCAAIARQGFPPAHAWMSRVLDAESEPLSSLFLHGQLGLYLLVRFGPVLDTGHVAGAGPWIQAFAVASALVAAMLALVARQPRRVLGLLHVGQSALVLYGLFSGHLEGVTGAVILWWVVSLASAMLLAIHGALEARTTEARSPRGFLGLGTQAPRQAAGFAVATLAIVGVPGTLGFVGDDLLFSDAMDVRPALAVGLLVAAGMMAISALRLFAVLFLGRRGTHVPVIAEMRRPERWGLACPMVLLVAGGCFPGVVTTLSSGAADWLLHQLSH